MRMKKIILIGGGIVLFIILLTIIIFDQADSDIDYSDPSIFHVKETTQARFKDLRIGVVNIWDGSGVVILSWQTDRIGKRVTNGDQFDFKNYHVEILKVKENTRLFPPSGGSNGYIVLRITRISNETQDILFNYAKIKNDPDAKSLENRDAYPAKGVKIIFNTLGGGYQKNIDLEKATLTKIQDGLINNGSLETVYLNQNQLARIADILNAIWETQASELKNQDSQCTDLYRQFILTDGNYSKSLYYQCPIENKVVKELDDYIKSIS